MKYPQYDGMETCERCHKAVDPKKAVWLELNHRTHRYEEPGTVPENESQGGFAFGPDCAEAVRKNNGKCVTIGLAKRNGA